MRGVSFQHTPTSPFPEILHVPLNEADDLKPKHGFAAFAVCLSSYLSWPFHVHFHGLISFQFRFYPFFVHSNTQHFTIIIAKHSKTMILPAYMCFQSRLVRLEFV